MMYPAFVDMNRIESSKSLRMLELDAYSNMLAALRAQGPPTVDKLKLLSDIAAALHIPLERCKAEIRKVVLDERLNTIAYYTCGQVETTEEWIKEGKRLVSLMPRTAAESIYSAIADEVADAANHENEQLPLPAHTERKRSISSAQGSSINSGEYSKSHQFKTPECLKNDDSNSKKRKLGISAEDNMLSEHLAAKFGKIQQFYRQAKNKFKTKDQQQPRFLQTSYQTKVQRCPMPLSSPVSTSPKINILQNISVGPSRKEEETENPIETDTSEERACESPQPGCSNDNQTLKPLKQTLVNIKPNPNITYKHVASPGPSSEVPKSLKICTTRKPVIKTLPGQKLVIVSNPQSITKSTMTHRTLTIPFKNVSTKTLDSFKIIPTSTNTSNFHTTPIVNSNVGASRHNLVTAVKSNSISKKVVPLAQLQALNAKGGLKMFPIGNKLLSKTTAISRRANIIDLNNLLGAHSVSRLSNKPVSVTPSKQDSICNDNVNIGENGDIHCLQVNNMNLKSFVSNRVTESDNASLIDDIESQITQLTAIPQTLPEKILADEHFNEEIELTENNESCSENITNRLISNGSTSLFDHETNVDIDLQSTAVLSMNVNSNMDNIKVNKASDAIVLKEDCTLEQMTSNSVN